MPNAFFDQNSQRRKHAAIAEALVRNYPCHDFVIDRDEALRIASVTNERGQVSQIGLQVAAPPTGDVNREIDWLGSHMNNLAAFGYLVDSQTGGVKP